MRTGTLAGAQPVSPRDATMYKTVRTKLTRLATPYAPPTYVPVPAYTRMRIAAALPTMVPVPMVRVPKVVRTC